MSSKVLNQDVMRSVNQKLVLQQIFNEGPISRIDVSKKIKLNKSTVSTLYNMLKENSLVVELGQGESTSSGGRKPIFTQVNAHWGYTVSFEIGYRHLHMMTNYLNGDIISFRNFDIVGMDIHQIIDAMRAKVRQINIPGTLHGLLGIGVAVSGTVLDEHVVHAPFIDMKDENIVRSLTGEFQVPVMMENEANLSAIYERDFNEAGLYLNTITVSIHKGIGAGIIIDSQLYRGLNGEAGEIGRSIMMDANVGMLDNFRKVEDFCSEDAIIGFAQGVKEDPSLQRDDLVDLFRSDDADIKKILDEFTTAIAKIIFNVASEFDPEAIFINSPLIDELPSLLEQIRQKYQLISRNRTRIRLAKDSQHATLLGACSLITHRVLKMDDYALKFV
ncbi:ROK family protein [Furfurilactobacillus rossiae]|uniref:ROK family protein n=1 Tax=Furfurilactobacillus rossiae DSM 15814 TaxID=1114972 RepID=A0A0R1RAH7_9LACO|nr:ROK family protein [Furfurilactobacillus rossiae]KRL53689.1 ROK family protein [Furfurilactobacillus rossiae DSM 15814]QLE60647.1 Transcriptional regulator-sugar kinase xylose operon regulator [Furfurilactobacillus rossiae]